LTPQEKKVGTLKGDSYFKAPYLLMDDQKIFIVDKFLSKGFIYNRKTLEQIAEFGDKGEAPSEFMYPGAVNIDDKYVYVSADVKLCIFTKEGKFVKEFRMPMRPGEFQPLGNNRFLANTYYRSRRNDINIKQLYRLYDNNVLFKKDFFTSEFHCYFRFVGNKKISYYPIDCVNAVVYKNNIYFGDTARGFYFAVFNRDGKQLYEIKLDFPKKRLSGDDKKLLKFQLSKRKKSSEFETETVIREEHPAYQFFYVNDDRIYVFTPVIDWKTRIYIMDLKGKNVRKTEVMHIIFDILPIGSQSYVHKGKLYYLKENQEDPDAGAELYEFDLLKNSVPVNR